MAFSLYALPLWILGIGLLAPLDFAAPALLGSLSLLLLTISMKVCTRRLRPSGALLAPRLVSIRSLERTNAMPSGDTAQAAFWWVLFAAFRARGMPPLAVALGPAATAFGRVFYGCHWAGDTIVGGALGAAFALATARVLVPHLAAAAGGPALAFDFLSPLGQAGLGGSGGAIDGTGGCASLFPVLCDVAGASSWSSAGWGIWGVGTSNGTRGAA
jgi:hypothetical protein